MIKYSPKVEIAEENALMLIGSEGDITPVDIFTSRFHLHVDMFASLRPSGLGKIGSNGVRQKNTEISKKLQVAVCFINFCSSLMPLDSECPLVAAWSEEEMGEKESYLV